MTATSDPREALFARLYAKVPRLECKGLCHEACGPIAASAHEVRRLEQVSGKALTFAYATGSCGHLAADHRCTVYAARPLICRLWGTTRGMRCPHGCRPVAWLSEAKTRRLLAQAKAIGGEDVYAAQGG